MKVLHYIPSMARHLGGVATYLSVLSGELGKRCELIVVTSVQNTDLPLKNCKVVNLEGFTFSDAGLGLSWSGMKGFAALCGRILDEERPDIVHVNGIWSLDRWIIQREALKMGIDTYITPHGMLEPWIVKRHYWTKKLPALYLYERRALRSAVRLVATADSEWANIKRLNVTKADVPVIPNGIDTVDIPLKSSWEKRRRILYVSRVHVKKGIEMLIDTCCELKKELKDYEIIIAGEGEKEYVDALKAKAVVAGVNISFVGGVYGEEKWRVFQDADFFVLPTNSENFGYVIAESLACGTPVITTKGAPWEDVVSSDCGCWIDRDIASLKSAILGMMSKSANELEAMGRRGRKLIDTKYSAKSMAESLMMVYDTNPHNIPNAYKL